MRQRVISALVGTALLLVGILVLPVWGMLLLMEAAIAIGAYEYLSAGGLARNRALLVTALSFALLVLPWVYWGQSVAAATAGVYLYILALFALSMGSGGRVTPEELGEAFFASLFIPLLFSALLRLRMGEYGRLMALMPFVISVMTDTCAFFVGRRFGKTGLAPGISPKKTREGALGGLAGGVGCLLLYALLLGGIAHETVRWGVVLLIGVACSAVSQFGDLAFSYCKRRFGIKDYGHIMPGHGGILDRLDSVLFAAPALELLLTLLGGIWR